MTDGEYREKQKHLNIINYKVSHGVMKFSIFS